MKTKLTHAAALLRKSAKPIQLTLEGENFSVVLELSEFDLDESDANGGFSITYNDGGISAEISFYNENHTLTVRKDSVLELVMNYDNGDAVEIVQ